MRPGHSTVIVTGGGNVEGAEMIVDLCPLVLGENIRSGFACPHCRCYN
jgi:hypothetical protein